MKFSGAADQGAIIESGTIKYMGEDGALIRTEKFFEDVFYIK